MSASFVRLLRNAKLATDENTTTHVHTLKVSSASPANTDTFATWGRGDKFATDEVAGVHTLKVKIV